MIIHNDRGPSPLDVGYCHIHTVEVESPHDARCEDLRWTHEVPHPFKGYVLAQVFNQVGDFIPLPGTGRTWKQQPNSILIPVVHENHYPIMVVMAG